MYQMAHTVQAMARSAASPNLLYRLLVDPASWPRWSGMDAVELERPGTEEPAGVGSVRTLSRGRTRGRDEVVALVADTLFSYVHLEGLPVRDYRGDVALEPDGEGTRIIWQVSFRPRYPGTGWFWRLVIGRLLRRMATGLADHAGRIALAQ